jgi:hypothetical protein
VRACEVQQHVAWGFNFASDYTFLSGTRTKPSLAKMLLTFVKATLRLFVRLPAPASPGADFQLVTIVEQQTPLRP